MSLQQLFNGLQQWTFLCTLPIYVQVNREWGYSLQESCDIERKPITLCPTRNVICHRNSR